MSFRLTVTKGKSEGKEFSFTKARVTVGRNHDNDLVLYDLNVSRHHFEIVMVQGRYQVRDAGSQNGTKLNDSPVLESPLFDGDRISIGALEFVFSGSDTQPSISMKDATEHAELNAPQSVEQRQTLEQIQTYAVKLKELEDMKKSGSNVLNKTGPLHTPRKKDPNLNTQKRIPTLRKRQPWLYVAIGGAVCVLVVGVFAALYKPQPPDWSDRKVPIGPKIDPQSYGAGNVDVSTPRRAQFVWKSVGGRAVLSFAAGGIDHPDEVVIELNGQRAMSVPVTGPAWGSEVEVKLPRKLLKPNEDNLLAFVAQPQVGEALRWGIRELSLLEEPLPPASLDKARELIKQADEAIMHRRIALGNLALAEEAYKRAVLYMEAIEPHPAEYAKAETAAKNATAELETILQSHLFSADRALKAGRREEAEATLRELLLYFPIVNDPRAAKVATRLDAFAPR